MHIYLAGPITGFPDRNRAVFNKWAERLELAGHRVFNPTSLPDSMDTPHALAYECRYICCNGVEAIAFIPGWENSKGSKVEHALAIALGLKLVYLGEDSEKIFNNTANSMPELPFCA